MTDLSKYKQPFDPDWPHGHTYLGSPARMICNDLKGGPYVFAVPYGQNHEEIRIINSNGRYGATQVCNAPAPKRTWWVNLYHNKYDSGEFMAVKYSSREEADEHAASYRIACIEVSEGEGLEDD